MYRSAIKLNLRMRLRPPLPVPLSLLFIHHSPYFTEFLVLSSAASPLKYWKNLRTQQSIFLVLDFIVHFSHYMFRPRLAAIFR
jgi:hypothetical protein